MGTGVLFILQKNRGVFIFLKKYTKNVACDAQSWIILKSSLELNTLKENGV